MSVPFLSNLGLSIQEQQAGPLADAMPQAFNGDLTGLWKEAVEHQDTTDTLENRWAAVIDEFVTKAIAQGRFPFLRDPSQNNAEIMQELTAKRTSLMDYLTSQSKLGEVFETHSLRSVERKVIFPEKGFIISVSVSLAIPTLDFLDLMDTLSFKRVGQDYYEKDISADVRIFFTAIDDRTVRFEYQIVSSMLPYITDNYSPTQGELEKFVLDTMYLPLIKMSRPSCFSKRLF